MFSLKIATRNLAKYPSFSLINTIGLSVGMASCMTVLLYIRDELSYDQHHDEADRIYRITRF